MEFNILYVEDNPDNLRLVKKVLGARGYTVHGAVTGTEGLLMAEELVPGVILLDINLPDIDGYEIARRIRKHDNSKLRNVPMIAITANALEGDAKKALDAGCDVYMSKPINIRELGARVEAFAPD